MQRVAAQASCPRSFFARTPPRACRSYSSPGRLSLAAHRPRASNRPFRGRLRATCSNCAREPAPAAPMLSIRRRQQIVLHAAGVALLLDEAHRLRRRAAARVILSESRASRSDSGWARRARGLRARIARTQERPAQPQQRNAACHASPLPLRAAASASASMGSKRPKITTLTVSISPCTSAPTSPAAIAVASSDVRGVQRVATRAIPFARKTPEHPAKCQESDDAELGEKRQVHAVRVKRGRIAVG